MNVLMLGGTGAIGRACIDLLIADKFNVTVTSRQNRQTETNPLLKYIKGDALSNRFITELLKENE